MPRSAFPRSLLLIALLILLAGCSNVRIDESDVFLPKPSVTPASFDVEGVTLEEMYFAVPDSVGPDGEVVPGGRDSLQLNAWHLTQPDAEATVLFYGGNGFYLVQSLGYIQALTDFPVNVFMFDYRGYGRSGGEPEVQAFKRDALAAYDVVTERLGADPDRLIVHGHSLGTFLATHAAAEREVAGLVLENPATDVTGWVHSIVPWFVRLFIDLEIDDTLQGESNVATLRRTDAPLLVLGGEKDNVTNPDMARDLYQTATNDPKNLVIVEDGTHNELYTSDAYRTAYRDLLDRVTGAVDTSQVAAGTPQ
jgi:fermentation-respiration switch protein FrsA (DUF1100 family)